MHTPSDAVRADKSYRRDAAKVDNSAAVCVPSLRWRKSAEIIPSSGFTCVFLRAVLYGTRYVLAYGTGHGSTPTCALHVYMYKYLYSSVVDTGSYVYTCLRFASQIVIRTYTWKNSPGNCAHVLCSNRQVAEYLLQQLQYRQLHPGTRHEALAEYI